MTANNGNIFERRGDEYSFELLPRFNDLSRRDDRGRIGDRENHPENGERTGVEGPETTGDVI